MNTFSLAHYQELIRKVTDNIAGKTLDQDLEDMLNDTFPSDSEIFIAIEAASNAGIQAGALCQHEAGGIKYGRAIKACDELQGYSVDLVSMENIIGPHHRHPKGEIDMIMPVTSTAKFDNYSAGWRVYAPDSAHKPTVSDGTALVLYLLPGGEIEFTRG